MKQYSDLFKEINQKTKMCWSCKIELTEDEVMQSIDDNRIEVELCFDCYMTASG